jgi:hypothetical protein
VGDELPEHALEMSLIADEHPVQALVPGGAHKALRKSVGLRLQLHPVVKVRALS